MPMPRSGTAERDKNLPLHAATSAKSPSAAAVKPLMPRSQTSLKLRRNQLYAEYSSLEH